MPIGKGKISAEINAIEYLTHELCLNYHRNYLPSEIKELSNIRGLCFVDTWKAYLVNSYYHFQFKDNSLLSFVSNGAHASYSYLSCPYMCMTYEEFLVEYYLFEGNIKECGDIFQEEYEEYLSTCLVSENPILIRYDYDPNSYMEGLHPVAHIHIGFNQNIRIGVSYKLTPIAFFYFLLRQIYPDKWQALITQTKLFNKYIKDFKGRLPNIDTPHYNEHDKCHDLYLK